MERHIAKNTIYHLRLFQPQCMYKISLVVTLRKWVLKVRMYYLTWIHPLVMGLEEHLLTMFRDDVEFNENVVPSHLASEVKALYLSVR